MSNDIDYSQDNISPFDDKKYQLEFENEKDQKTYRKWLFYTMGIAIIIMFIISYTAVYCYIFFL